MRRLLRRLRVRLTVFQTLLAVAVCAIATHLATEALKNSARTRFDRCIEIADNHARMGREYRQNPAGNPAWLRIATWHESMQATFEEAAARPEIPMPTTTTVPPPGWQPPESSPVSGRSGA